MKVPAEVFVLVTGCSLAAIQIRHIIRGELSIWGGLKQWSELNVDSFDKVMLTIAGISFCIFAYIGIP